MLLTIIREAVGCYLVITLTATSFGKLQSWRNAATGVRLGKVIPRSLAVPTIVAVSAAELTIAVLLVTGVYPAAVGLVTAGVFLSFGAYKVAVSAKTGNLACNCSGATAIYKATRPGVPATIGASASQAAFAVLWVIIPPSAHSVFDPFLIVAFVIPVLAFAAGRYRGKFDGPPQSHKQHQPARLGAQV
jgi:hypothetical protein